MKRVDWLFPALFLGVLFAGYGLVPLPRTREKADSFSVDRGGKRVFFELAANLLPDVKRSAGPLVPADPAADVLVLLGPARYPDRAQWQTLHDWVSGGRTLIFAAKWQDPAIELEPFGIEIVPTLEAGESEGGESPEENEEAEAAEDEAQAIETELVAGPIEWRSFGQIRFLDPKASIMLSTGGLPQVIWQPVGEGAVVVVASDFVFSNLSVVEPANALLALRILELGAPAGPVYFDEGMNAAGAPSVVGVMFEGPLRLPMLQLILVTVLFGWMASRRFGPLVTRSLLQRRSLVEHAEALGSLHFKVGTRSTLLGSYMEYFGRELGISYRTGAKGRREMELSDARKPLDRASAEALARAIRAVKSHALDRARVASLIRGLAALRARDKGSA